MRAEATRGYLIDRLLVIRVFCYPVSVKEVKQIVSGEPVLSPLSLPPPQYNEALCTQNTSDTSLYYAALRGIGYSRIECELGF
jgi:hypothetical protein